jgi:hypothetical protein
MKPRRTTASSPARTYPLLGDTDAAGHVWYEVPGYGFVHWTHEQITRHAQYVLGFHRPGRTGSQVRLACGALPLVWLGRRCKVCQTNWPCRTALWVHDWLRAVAVAGGTEIPD